MKFHLLCGHTFPEAKGLCVVIDVLRAFTTAAFAFASGASEIILVSSPEEAFNKYRQDPALLLMGEQEGLRVEGFHFANSPIEMRRAVLAGSRMVQRSSSGTQGVVGCCHAPYLLISSFVVAEATVQRILELQPTDVSFIATGRKNGDEDIALAEYLQARLEGNSSIDSRSFLDRVRVSPAAQRMLQGPVSYPDALQDLELALHVDRFSFAMEVARRDGDLVAKAVNIRTPPFSSLIF